MQNSCAFILSYRLHVQKADNREESFYKKWATTRKSTMMNSSP
jgi:hypothetical protein